MSWEEALHRVVRTYYHAGRGVPPAWVSATAATLPEPLVRANTTCGDRVTVYLDSPPESAGEARRIWLDVAGCAICKASGEMAVRAGQVLSPQELTTLARDIIAGIETSSDSEDANEIPLMVNVAVPAGVVPVEDLETILTLRDVPGRRRCASLPWEAVLAALEPSR